MRGAALNAAAPLLALFGRSLREDARLRRTYVARAGLVAIVAVLIVVAIFARGWRGAPGLHFFAALAQIQSVCITLAGLSYFASAITEEKEEGMLGLLRMSELDPVSILLGKSTSRLCGVLLLLAVQFPFTLLAVALGGVTVRQIVAAYLALGAYTIFLCNLALLASVVSRRTGHAAAWVGAVLAALWLGPWLLTDVPAVATFSSRHPLVDALGSGIETLSIGARLDEVLSTGFKGVLFGPQFAWNLGAGVLCFVAAWLVFDRSCERESGEGGGGGGQWLRRRIRPGRPWPRPLVWKDVWFMHGGRGVALFKFAAYGTAIAIFVGQQWMSGGVFTRTGARTLLIAAGFGLLVFLVELGVAASRMYRLEVQAGTFPGLALLPCRPLDLHRAKVQSCYYAVLPIAVWAGPCLGGWFLLACVDKQRYPMVVLVFGLTMLIVYVLPQVMLFFNFVVWLSLRTRHGALPLGLVAMGVGNLPVALAALGGFNLVAFLGGALTCGFALLAVPIWAIGLARLFRDLALARLEELTGQG